MQPASRDGLVSGLAIGVSVGLVFAVAMRFVPATWLVEPVGLAALYAAAAPMALVFVPIATCVARLRGDSPHRVLLWACCGAMALDGLALGFAPALYGHVGLARTAVATLLLWAFAWIVAAALLLGRGSATEPIGRGVRSGS